MSIIYILIPVAALLTALGIYLFFWAVKTEQFDDLEKQGMSILFDEKDLDENDKSGGGEVASYKKKSDQEKEKTTSKQSKQSKQ